MAKYGNYSILLISLFVSWFYLSLYLNRFGRDNFQEALKVASRAGHASIDWKNFKFMVFDVPTLSGTYNERYQYLGMCYYVVCVCVCVCVCVVCVCET